MFRSLFIANRGEIAVRLMRTCRRLGIRSVAAYSEADREALHVEFADEAVEIGPSPAAESYLNIERLLDAARRCGAEAIHPGYGFLSENAEFASACVDAGFVFVGPHAEAIRQMGSKEHARRLAREHGVPVLPGYDGEDPSPENLRARALEIGFPIMIKASAGGGGRGIRIVEDESRFDKACEQAAREAQASFGDGRLVVERYVQQPRHIEVQVVGDRHGRLLHCFERECSIQRRHQKVVEEAPASRLSATARESVLNSACTLARAIGYDSVGTVEFILDDETGEAFFLEMNTRLQVEHPTTEMITGLDLVELQLRSAAGEPLTLEQEQIRVEGWAIEVRLNAEDPSKKFLPRTGRIDHLVWPETPHLRFESGVQSGSVITPFYDSLLAKVVAWGDDRDQAIARLVEALDRTVLFGPVNNLAFLRQVVDHEAFRSASLTTHFIDEHFPKGLLDAPAATLPDPVVAALAQVASSEPGGSTPWHRLGAWRLLSDAGQPAARDVFLEEGKRIHALRVWEDGRVDFDQEMYPVEVRVGSAGTLELESGGRLERVGFARHGERVALVRNGRRPEYRVLPREQVWRTGVTDSTGQPDAVVAPFPGQVAEVRVKAGDTVSAGEIVVVLEAMKMFHHLVVGGSGCVSEVLCAKGQSVTADEVLVRFENPESRGD
ncbi:ATP-grasp domain-containing protein [Myxococcota bacterium]|nr:ATP-grasp domain-containing protein [Myxococcota bacterium]